MTRDGAWADPQRERLLPLVRELDLTPGHGYRELAVRLRAAIASGELPVGSRLPPQRELAGLLAVGRTTVVAAYNLLRAEALVEMTQGAGTWVVRRPRTELVIATDIAKRLSISPQRVNVLDFDALAADYEREDAAGRVRENHALRLVRRRVRWRRRRA